MTLAHLPTKRAQDLLARFKESERADEVEWLEPAIEEGKMWTIWPENEQEERDMLALKLYHKKDDHIVELMTQCDAIEYKMNQYEIELTALKELQKDRLNINDADEIKYKIITLTDLICVERKRLEKIRMDIELEEKIAEKIKAGIKTERYRDLESWDILGFHFDGEK